MCVCVLIDSSSKALKFIGEIKAFQSSHKSLKIQNKTQAPKTKKQTRKHTTFDIESFQCNNEA